LADVLQNWPTTAPSSSSNLDLIKVADHVIDID
jgi:hypothetical protein